MNNDLSILKLVLDAGPVVQAIMLLLLAASVWSWYIIIRKRRLLGRAQSVADRFESEFWSGSDLSSLSSRPVSANSSGWRSRTTCRPSASSRRRGVRCASA